MPIISGIRQKSACVRDFLLGIKVSLDCCARTFLEADESSNCNHRNEQDCPKSYWYL
jgi:hypothetical protein